MTQMMSLYELRDIAKGQKDQIQAQQRMILAEQHRLQRIKDQFASRAAMELKETKRQRLKESIGQQELRLRNIKAWQAQYQQLQASNQASSAELESLRSSFSETEKELSVAMAKVEALSRQLEELRKGNTKNSYQLSGKIRQPWTNGSSTKLELQAIEKRIADRKMAKEVSPQIPRQSLSPSSASSSSSSPSTSSASYSGYPLSNCIEECMEGRNRISNFKPSINSSEIRISTTEKKREEEEVERKEEDEVDWRKTKRRPMTLLDEKRIEKELEAPVSIESPLLPPPPITSTSTCTLLTSSSSSSNILPNLLSRLDERKRTIEREASSPPPLLSSENHHPHHHDHYQIQLSVGGKEGTCPDESEHRNGTDASPSPLPPPPPLLKEEALGANGSSLLLPPTTKVIEWKRQESDLSSDGSTGASSSSDASVGIISIPGVGGEKSPSGSSSSEEKQENSLTESDRSGGSISSVQRSKSNLKISVEGNFKAAIQRKVSFDPLAVLLDAALEGELDLVQKTSKEVPNVSAANEDGITALHNAIYANHYDVFKFLIEAGHDVNTPDSEGWTPLHCAASCNSLSMIKFLVEHGACILTTTSTDHETAAEKCDEEQEDYDGCSQYMSGIVEKLGVLNGGVVYAVYDYQAQQGDELSFRDGDRLVILKKGDETESEWWWARFRDREGYVPRNLLGLYPRIRPRRELTNSSDLKDD